MISQSLTGDVKSNSMVPNFCSSAKSLIVKAGASRTITRLAPKKRLLRDASGKGSVKSLTKKNPVTAKNIKATAEINLYFFPGHCLNGSHCYNSSWVVSLRKISSKLMLIACILNRLQPLLTIDLEISSLRSSPLSTLIK